ncbi:MAG TPA: hypothetical protein VHO26_08250 [Propionibacteriaceae bacterium]|nr:hypothetical protein [Propionibacteriaceae bacterium]
MVSQPQPRRGTVADAGVPVSQALEIVSIDCHSCRADASACSDCVVAVLLPESIGTAPALDADERRALSILSQSGLVPPLRYQPPAG